MNFKGIKIFLNLNDTYKKKLKYKNIQKIRKKLTLLVVTRIIAYRKQHGNIEMYTSPKMPMGKRHWFPKICTYVNGATAVLRIQ